MADIEAEIEAAIASGNVDDATLDRLIAGARAELGKIQAARPPGPYKDGYKLEEHGPKLPDIRAVRLANRRAKTAAIEAEPDPMSPLELVKALPRGMADNAAAMGSAFNEHFALGLPARLMDALGVDSPEQRAAAKELSPVGQVAGATVGLGTGLVAGPEKVIAQAYNNLAARAPGLGRMTSAGLQGGLTGGTIEGAKAALDQAPIEEIGERAAAGAVGGAMVGGGLGALGEAGGAIGRAGRALAGKLRDERSALGGGADTLTTLDRMRESGALKGNIARKVNDPELEALPRGKKGYARASKEAREKISGHQDTDLAQARKDYDEGLKAIEKDLGKKPFSMEGPQARIDALRAENSVNGETVDDALGAALDKVQRMITVKSPEAAGNPLVANASARESTVADMLTIKRALAKRAEFGDPATPENRPYRLLHREFAKQAEGIDPRIGQLNQRYKTAMDKLEEGNDILFGQDATAVASRPASRRRAAGLIMRKGDDTTAGELADEELERLAALDPRYKAALQKVEEKKALERTRFGMPNMSKSPEKWGVGLLEQNLEALRARAVDPLLRTVGRLAPFEPLPGQALGGDEIMRRLARAQLQGQAGGEVGRERRR